MTDADIKRAIKTIEVHHEHGWWVADMPDIGVATQAKTLPELGVEIERIVIAHFEVCAEHDADPLRCKRLSSIDEVTETLNVVLKTRTATYAAMASALREIERRLIAAEDENDLLRIRAEVIAAASAVSAVAALVETPLTTKVGGN
jgi:hypothetical protein